ncbi:MAG: hypothetical protein AAF358_10730 [Pseudomonadota bacterium]
MKQRRPAKQRRKLVAKAASRPTNLVPAVVGALLVLALLIIARSGSGGF